MRSAPSVFRLLSRFRPAPGEQEHSRDNLAAQRQKREQTKQTFLVVRREILESKRKQLKSTRCWQWFLKTSWDLAPYTVILVSLLMALIVLVSAIPSLMYVPIWLNLKIQDWLHPSVLVATAYATLFIYLTLIPALIIALTVIQPCLIALLSRQFPSAMALADDGIRFAFPGTRGDLLIPWNYIETAQLRRLMYQGLIETDVLQIDLRADPPLNTLYRWIGWLRALGLRSPFLYLDHARHKLPEHTGYRSLWLPLDMLGSERDRAHLLASLHHHIPEDKLDVGFGSELALHGGSSFTTLWLNDLFSAGKRQQRTLPSGTQLKDGSYVIEKVIGTGAFSVVYKATRLADNHSVAIKEFLVNTAGGQLSSDNTVRHIMSEVEILRHLEHESIVKVSDCFAQDCKIYVGMELIEGQNLREYVISHHPLPERQLLDLFAQCLKIVIYLHERKPPVLHGDLAPDNFVLSQGGQLKLVDFNVATSGAAHRTHDDAGATAIGKHCYMAPEQFRGEQSTASDLYQIGATMYFLSTGEDPEPLSSSDPHDRRADLSAGLVGIITTMTALDAGQRYTSAAQVLQNLTALSAGDSPDGQTADEKSSEQGK